MFLGGNAIAFDRNDSRLNGWRNHNSFLFSWEVLIFCVYLFHERLPFLISNLEILHNFL
jgi:hypothetical protein